MKKIIVLVIIITIIFITKTNAAIFRVINHTSCSITFTQNCFSPCSLTPMSTLTVAPGDTAIIAAVACPGGEPVLTFCWNSPLCTSCVNVILPTGAPISCLPVSYPPTHMPTCTSCTPSSPTITFDSIATFTIQ